MLRFLVCLVSLLLLPCTAGAVVLVDLHSGEGQLAARLLISGDTLLVDDQGQVQLTAADQLLCTLTVSAPEEMEVSLPSFAGPSYGDFTLLEQGEVSSRRTGHGLDHERQWLIEPYNPGPYQLPELLISGRLGAMTTELILPRPELIAQDIAASAEGLDDILPPQAPAPALTRMISLTALALIALALAVWLVLRRTSKGGRRQPPKERALAELALVHDLQPRAQVERLAFILRCYLDSRFELRSLEQTYDEYSAAMAGCQEIPEQSRAIFLAVLERCDLIKFSNIDPEPGEPEAMIAQITAGLEACPLAKADDKTCGRW